MDDAGAGDVIFALSPANAIIGLLNFTKSEHHKIYKSGIKAVSDTAYNCEADGLFQFLREIKDRSIEMGWMEGILNINIAEDEDDEELSNLNENYGTQTLEQVTRWEKTYIAMQNREAQDTYIRVVVCCG
jgi:hypothetical protein